MIPGDTSLAGHARARSIELDLLRAVAIVLVLFRHAPAPPDRSGWLHPFASVIHGLGWSGVDLFFVLSGFLVGGLLFAELKDRGQVDVGRFLIRRGFKIWPPYAIYLVCIFAGLALTEPGGVRAAFARLLPNFVHLQNYFGQVRRHTWSLAVEEHFYLVLPFVIRAAWRKGSARAAMPSIPAIALGLVVACTAARVATRYLVEPFALEVHSWPTHLRIDGLFVGVALAYLKAFAPSSLEFARAHHRALLLAGVAMIMPMGFLPFNGYFVPTIGLTLLYLGYATILLGVVYAPSASFVGRFSRTRAARAISFVGLYSYSIYLWHIDLAQAPLMKVMKRLPLEALPPEVVWVGANLAMIALAVAMGFVTAKLIERPSLLLRDRLFPSRTRATALEVEPSPLASAGQAAP